jgi:bacillopeptidase F
MAEFKRSRLERRADEQITKKTIFLGIFTVLLFVFILAFGLPLLVRFSVFLGDSKNKHDSSTKEAVLPPVAPRLVVPFEATNSANINITGYAEANVGVELMKNDVSVGKTQVSGSGDFVFNDVELNEGDNVFTAVAITDKGGRSETSKPAVVLYTTRAPQLTMTNPSEDTLTVDYADFDIIGQSEKGVSVTVNSRVAMVDDDGKFKFKMQLNAGKNDIEIVVRDMAGNETKKKITITYDI